MIPNQHQPLSLSIVIPNHNHAAYLPEAVSGYLAPAGAADEVVVVDDASTDESMAVLRRLAGADSRIRVIAHEANRGPVAALNTGLAAARGDWIVFRGADDLCAFGSLTTFRAIANRFPRAGVIAGDPVHFEIDPERGVRERLGRVHVPTEVDHETFLDLYGSNIIHGPFCRTEWVRAAGGFDEALRWHCDWFLYLALGLMRGFVYAPAITAAIRMHPESYNSAGTAQLDTQRRVLERVLSKLEREPLLLDRVLAGGCLDFFGERLLRVLRDGPDDRRRRFGPVFSPPGEAVRRARMETGLASVLRAFLVTHAERIREHAGSVSVFGAGGHTRLLLEIWRTLGLPLPVAILDTSPEPASRDIDRIPVRLPDGAAAFARPLVVLSSRSYERLLASTAATLLPHVPCLAIWADRGRGSA